ncbi:MAG: dihydropteroate synthase [Nocardioidaceae bacterium]
MPGLPRRYVEGLPQPARCLVMGVVNVTPDSFSDGGLWLEPEAAIEHGKAMLQEGADLVDVGGESTRPGARRPSVDVELGRVLPVVTELSRAGAIVSVDTMRASVARAAVEAGAGVINDVSGGRADPDMLTTAASLGVPYIGMHWRGHSASMHELTSYVDVVTDVIRELEPQIERALAAGIRPEHLVVDPGLGFAKTGDHNWTVLARIEELHELGYPVLVGASRKAFLGTLLADAEGRPRPAVHRDAASAVLAALAALSGVWCVRVHDVSPSIDAVKVAARYGREPRP